MVQLFYWESRGQNTRKLLQAEGHPNQVLLFPYEGWARPSCHTYWILKPYWWNKKRCKVVQICGSTKTAGKGKMVDTGNGNLLVLGRLKNVTECPDFRLTLSTDISNTDFQLGYSMTGTLERGYHNKGTLEFTHFAMIKRKGY